MSPKRFKYILFSICLMTLSCSIFSSGDSDDQEQLSLVDTKWEVVRIEITEKPEGYYYGLEIGVYELPDGIYILEFVGESGVRGTFFCNSCVGNYEVIPPDSIYMSAMGCTRALCGFSPPIQGMVSSSNKFELTQNNLILHYESEWHGKGSLYSRKMDVE